MILLIISILLILSSGISKAIKDKVNFHYSESVFTKYNPMFWDHAISGNNKWKDGIKANGPKFIFSSTSLVFMTDAWHLFQFIENILLSVGYALLGMSLSDNVLYFIISIPILYISRNIIFEIFFKTIFTLKQ